MVNENLSDKNVAELVKEVLPLPRHSQTEKIRRNIADLRKELMYRYTHAPDLQKFRGTAWGFIGAVSDFVSHSPPRRKTKTYRENNFAKLVSGHRILDRAYNLIA